MQIIIEHPNRSKLMQEIDSCLKINIDYYYDKAHYYDLNYRISSWSISDKENIAIFYKKNSDTALAILYLQIPFWSIDYFIRKDLSKEVIIDYIIPWITKRQEVIRSKYYSQMKFFFWYEENFKPKNLLFEELLKNNWTFTHLRLDLDVWEDYEYDISKKFVIRSLRNNEIEKYVDLHQQAFQTKNMNLEWRENILKSPQYLNEVDLVVEYSSDILVAFCVFWVNNSHKSASLEPMGVSEKFRGRYLGKAIIIEGLKRLQKLKIEKVFVTTETDNQGALALYNSVGFKEVAKLEGGYL